MSLEFSARHWPYPRWIAHRGAGKLAPENTLAAFRLGAAHGYRMFECDVKLSADDVPFLLHDATLSRTTDAGERRLDATALAGEQRWGALAELDAGSWHGRAYAGEPLPSLQAVARYCRANHLLLNIEIKPSPGTDGRTGEVVAQHAARLWQGAPVPPLLTSFEVTALEAAQHTQPELPRGLLLEAMPPDWLQTALRLGCVAVVCDHLLWTSDTVAQAKAAGLRTLSYTVNDADAAHRLLDLQTDGLITDRVDLFAPAD